MGKVCNKPAMMKEASLFLPVSLSPWPQPNANCCFNYRDLGMYSDHRLYWRTLIYLL